MRSRWLAAALVAVALAGCSSSTPKAAKGKVTTTSTTTSTTAPTSSSTTTTAAVSTTVGKTTTTSAVTGTTRTLTPVPPRTVTATSADNGRTLSLHVGDTLVVQLSGCGGCGYSWEMTGQPNAVVFQYEGTTSTTSTTSTSAGTPPIVGAPVTYTWTFKALSAHTTGFVAGYFPPGQTKPSQTYQVGLTVTNS